MSYSKGPWTACHGGNCSCKQVWCDDYPVAVVTVGKWGDTYPAIRLVEGDGMAGTHAEAYLERIDYGDVPEGIAKANARLIAAAPDMYEALKALNDNHFGKVPWRQENLKRLVNKALVKAKGIKA